MPRKEIDLLANQLRRAIEASPKSLRQISADAGMDVSNLSRFMNGKRDLPLARYAAVGRAVGLDLRWVEQSATTAPAPKRKKRKSS